MSTSAYSYGGSSSTYAYSAKLKEVIRNPDGSPKNTTEVVFQVLIPHELVKNGERVVLSGSLQELGNWTDSIRMTQNPDEPNIWFAAVQLPFTATEQYYGGLFEFKYAVMSAGDLQWEGTNGSQGDRRKEKNMMPSFYHAYKATHRHGQTNRGWPWKSDDPILMFTRAEITRMMQTLHVDATASANFVSNFDGISDCCLASRRSHGEQLYEEAISRQGGELPTFAHAALLSMVGAYGVSYTDSAAVGARGIPGQCREWTQAVLYGLSVEEWVGMSLERVVGKAFTGWALNGIKEVAQRVHYQGSYAWLRLAPIMQIAKDFPDFSTKGHWTSKKAQDDAEAFTAAAKELLESTMDALTRGAEMKRNLEADAYAAAAPGEASKVKIPEPPALKVGRMWMEALVQHAPTASTLLALFDHPLLEQQASSLIGAVGNKLQKFRWEKSDMSKLRALVLKVPEFKSPKLAAAMLRNASRGVDQDDLLNIIQLCTEGHVMADPRGVEMGAAGEDAKKEHPDLATLGEAAREWVRRMHGMEPERKKVKKPKPMFSLAPDVWETVPMSEQELVLERTQALAEAVPSCEKLLALPVFAQNQHGVVHELSQCFFLKGNPVLVIQALCSFAPTANGFQCSKVIAQMLTRRGAGAARDAIAATSTPEREFATLCELITRGLPRASGFSHTLLFALIQAAHPDISRENLHVPLDAVLNQSQLWLTALEWVYGKGSYHTTSPLSHICNSVRVLLDTAIGELCSGVVPLRKCHVMLADGGTRITQLASRLKTKNKFEQQTLDQLKAMLGDFDRKLQALNCYLSVYCNCGDVEVDIDQMQGLSQHLTSEYDGLALLGVQNVFDGIPCMQFMDWLYQLRGSMLFLQLWRRHLQRAVAPVDQGQALLDEQTNARMQELQNALNQAQAEGNAEQAQAYHQALMDIMQQRMAQQEQAEQQQPEVNMLRQDAMEAVVIPAVQAEWVNTMTIVKDMTMPIPTVAALFGDFNRTEMHQELQTLAATGNPAQSEIGAAWHKSAQAALDEYMHLSQLRVWFPGVMRAATALQQLLAISADCDPLWVQLHEHSVTLNKEWNSASLATVTFMSKSTSGVFPGLSPLHLDFLAALGNNPELTEWLLDKASNEEFQKLLQVCRQNNDEARVVSAIASLVRVRTAMLNTFYETKYANLKEFVTHVGKMDLLASDEEGDQSVLWHYNNAAANFDALVEMFSKQTHSPGIKACYDLAGIKESGTFVIRSSSKDSEVLTLEIVNATSGNTRCEVLEFMLDIRNHVLLTEIPPEIEDELNINALTEAFVPQLRTLCEIKQAVCSLNDSGHIDYQVGYEKRFSFEIDGLAALEHCQRALVQELQQFHIVVRTARAKFGLLNYFTMREILHLHTLSSKISSEKNDAVRQNWVAELTTLMYLVSSHVEDSWMISGLDAAAGIDMVATDSKMQALLEAVGCVLAAVFSDVPFCTREVPLPGQDSANRSDMLVTVGDDQQPIFVACSNTPIDAILSVYVRRGRLPEPSEVLFCTHDPDHAGSVVEDITLLMWRFFLARKCGREECIFSVCDVQLLTYAQQCAVMESLNLMLEEFGTANCSAGLLFVSTQPRQLLLNALSGGMVELLPLDVDELHRACSHAMEHHLGTTMVVTSEREGGGKSHWIQKWVAGQQAEGNFVLYRKIPFREESTADQLLSSLKNYSGELPNAFHLDLGHIVPTNTNSVLFNLLLVGSLRDWSGVKVYPRRKQDVFLIEVANSIGDKTAEGLRVCSILPSQRITMTPDNLDFTRPVFTNDDGTGISCPRYDELIWTAKFIQAFEQNKFMPGECYDPEYHPIFDCEEMHPSECYTIFERHCEKLHDATFLTFATFTKFMNHSIRRLNEYPLLQGSTLAFLEGLSSLKHVYVELLIQTARDFTLRHVRRADLSSGAAVDDAAPAAPAAFVRTNSRTYNEALERQGSGPQAAALVRTGSRHQADLFSNMLSWESSDHPIVYFNHGWGDEVSGVGFISVNREFLDQFVTNDLRHNLEAQGIELTKDWSELTAEQAVEVLTGVEGMSAGEAGAGVNQPDPGYIYTIDNLLKMLSIQMRLKYDLPVVISGETGCGKSSVIKQMCAVTGMRLRTIDIHGGITDSDIVAWMNERLTEAAQIEHPMGKLVVFFDEVNTCNCMGLFKEIVCDHSMNGVQLPSNIKVIAACNPYRKRPKAEGDENVGLVFEHHASGGEAVASGIVDNLADLVYRVHPLPETMMNYVFDFGALSPETEALYIGAILSNVIDRSEEDPVESTRSGVWSYRSSKEEFIEVYAKLVCASQEFVREHENERAAVSLRDVARCAKVFVWFGRHFSDNARNFDFDDFCNVRPSAQPAVKKAMILALAYCYHARLPSESRRNYRNNLATAWRNMTRARFQFAMGQGYERIQVQEASWLDISESSFNKILEDAQRSFAQHMNIGEGIALNEALCDNIFMILVSILNMIPIFVVGKPGSSKSLAMDIVQSNLNGDASENEWLRTLPAVELFSYQCSPLSKSDGIEQAFETARRYKKGASNTLVCVLLDEVGLAEQSPHLPLKVLHKCLDAGDVAVVGISNWTLDPAKMNRAVHVHRAPPSVTDLRKTADGMVRNANLKGYLQAIAQAYNKVYLTQKQADFWGLREFYSTVRYINQALETSQATVLSPEVLMEAVQRNFGGKPLESQVVVEEFFQSLRLNQDVADPLPVLDLIKHNLHEPEARHLMVLTRNNAALSLLFDRNVLQSERTEVLFGSDFPDDQSDLQVMLMLQRVKLCMGEGVTAVLVHCESLFESLYDLLNQHYTEYGGQMYVRLAFGTHSRLCPIQRGFRVVVVVEASDAYNRLAPPLLNRFEKQVLERRHLLQPHHNLLVGRLTAFVQHIAAGKSTKELRQTVCGFHKGLIDSLVLCTAELFPEDMEACFKEAVRRLLWVAMPEAICSAPELEEYPELQQTYFAEQTHSDLCTYVKSALPDAPHDALGSQIVAMTYAALGVGAHATLSPQCSSLYTVLLHELSSERDLIERATMFFSSEHTGDALLLIQADPDASSLRRIEHCKHIIANIRAKHLRSAQTQGAAGEGAASEHSNHRLDVVLLVHLSRNNELFCFDFDAVWTRVFVDSVQPAKASGLPPVERILGQSLTEIVSEMELSPVLLAYFRGALTRISYSYERTNAEVRDQISSLVSDIESPEFIGVLTQLITVMVQSLDGDDDGKLDITAAAREPLQLTLAGTFQASLHRQISEIVSKMFAILLGHMDRNNNLKLFENTDLSHLWLDLFKTSWERSRLFDRWIPLIRAPEKVFQVEVSSDSAGRRPFKARFPFSFFVNGLVESMRGAAESSSEAVHEGLQGALNNVLQYDWIAPGQLSRDLIEKYVYDHTCMRVPEVAALDAVQGRQLQAKLTMRLLELFDLNRPVDSIALVHARWWQSERTLLAYLALATAAAHLWPSGANAFTMFSILHDDSIGGLSSDLDLHVVLKLLELFDLELLDKEQSWSTPQDMARWTAARELARPTVTAIFELSAHTASPELLAKAITSWEKLSFTTKFVQVVIAECGIAPSESLAIWRHARSTNLRSGVAFSKLVTELLPQVLSLGNSISVAKAQERFMEYYLFDFCLTPTANSLDVLETALLEQAVEILATTQSLHQQTSLITALVSVPDAELRAGARQMVEHLVAQQVTEQGMLDTDFAISLSVLLEKQEPNLTSAMHSAFDQGVQLPAALFRPDESQVIASLARVSALRKLLSAYATRTCNKSRGLDAVVCEAVEAVLAQFSAADAGIGRSVCMFLLKVIERSNGTAFLREQLQQGALSSSPWLQAWREQGEPGFERFLGSNRLPPDNPLCSIPGFAEAKGALSEALNTADCGVLTAAVSEGSPRQFGSLIAALFHEVYLFNCLETGLPNNCAAISRWVEQAAPSSDPFEQGFPGRALMSMMVVPSFPGSHGLCVDSSSEELLALRAACHALTASLTSDNQSLLAVLAHMVLNPEAAAKMFLPTMAEDEASMAMAVMGGRWYACPKGHKYYVDACGRPTEILKCHACGAKIGGLDHDLLGDNADVAAQNDNSPPGFAPAPSEKDANNVRPVRKLTPVTMRLLRVIVHGVLAITAISGGQQWEPIANKLINKDHCVVDQGEALSTFFLKTMMDDWKALELLLSRTFDEVATLVHASTQLLSERCCVAPGDQGNFDPLLATVTDRAHWEACALEALNAEALGLNQTEQLPQRLAEWHSRFCGQDDAGPFLAELSDSIDLHVMSREARAVSAPGLWVWRRPFSRDHLQSQLTLESPNAKKHPVLAKWLAMDTHLQPLTYFPGVLRWFGRLQKRFSMKIDLAQARELTVGQVLQELDEEDVGAWQADFEQYQQAWEHSKQLVKNFGCLTLPDAYMSTELSHDTPLSFSLPFHENEGIVPLALTQWLANEHNTFLYTVDELLLMSGSDVQRNGPQKNASISSRFVGPSHMLQHSVDDLLQFVEHRCSAHSGSDLIYDLEKAERYLIEKSLSGKPVIDLELRMFEFSSDISSIGTALLTLKDKLDQEPLPPDAEQAARRELANPAAASKCKELVEVALSFLAATGGDTGVKLGSSLGNLPLAHYVRDVLLLPEDSLVSSTVITRVRLRHLAALFSLLRDLTAGELFGTVQGIYKVDLTAGERAMVESAREVLPLELLLPNMKEFIERNLESDTFYPEVDLKENLGCWEVLGSDADLMDMDWYETDFPAGLALKSITACYKVLSGS